MSSIVDILVVDDEDDWRSRMKELVEGEFTVHEASSREEALSRIEKQFYYCALIDIRLMPSEGNDESGIEILRALARLDEGTKGLILTGHGDNSRLTKAALIDGKAVDYILKKDLDSLERNKLAQDQIREVIITGRKDYLKRYGSGIGQLTAGFTDRKSQSVWETDVIVSIGKGGGYEALTQFLDVLLEAVPPLIPYEPGEPIKIDRTSATVEGRYWSKGLGESVLIKFGRMSDIETMMQSLAPEMVIRRFNHKPYGGFVIKAGLRFEDLPQRT